MRRFCSWIWPSTDFSEHAWHQQVAAQDPASLYAPHYDHGRFFNPWHPEEKTWRDILRFFLAKSPYQTRPALKGVSIPLPQNGAYLHDAQAPDSLTMLGHSSLALQLNGQTILFDPFLSDRAFSIKRYRPPAIRNLPEQSLVLISHNHYDHLDKTTIAQLPKSSFFCPLGMGSLLAKWGARHIQELDWWQEAIYNNLRLVFLPAHHWSKRLGQGGNRSLWGAWLVESRQQRVFFGGDSAYFIGYQEIGRKFPGIDLALLPCGAFAPRWFMHLSHLNVEEMFMAFADLRAKTLVPIHWGAIALGHEPADEPARLIQKRIRRDPCLQDKVRCLPTGGRLIL